MTEIHYNTNDGNTRSWKRGDNLIGNMISEARIQKGLTQKELSKETGLSRSYICDLEKNRYVPSVKALAKIASCLSLDLNFLTSMTEIHGIDPDNKAG